MLEGLFIAKRTSLSQQEHDKLVSEIAKARFSYTDGTKTYTNPDGEKNCSMDNEYPDIVAVKDKTVVAIGEVETEETVNEEEAKQWISYAAFKTNFYLYVPKPKVSDAMNLMKSKKIGVTGLRSYEYVDDKLVVTDIQI